MTMLASYSSKRHLESSPSIFRVSSEKYRIMLGLHSTNTRKVLGKAMANRKALIWICCLNFLDTISNDNKCNKIQGGQNPRDTLWAPSSLDSIVHNCIPVFPGHDLKIKQRIYELDFDVGMLRFFRRHIK